MQRAKHKKLALKTKKREKCIGNSNDKKYEVSSMMSEVQYEHGLACGPVPVMQKIVGRNLLVAFTIM
jgi:hypothetical protein